MQQHRPNAVRQEIQCKIDAIKQRIKNKKELLKQKKKDISLKKEKNDTNLRFAKEKNDLINHHFLVISAFNKKRLDKNDKTLEGQKESTVSISRKAYLQRQTRVINDLYNIFFTAEC